MPNPLSPPAERRLPTLTIASGPFPGAGLLGVATVLPLQGVTILAVEDSRFACEALRLMARRAGARLRRADRLDAARAHLKVYRPDVVLVDLGLPDGRGEALIRDLVVSRCRPSVVLGMSGQPEGRQISLAAGADGFLEKPIAGLEAFCRVLRPLLPDLDIQPASAVPDHPAPDHPVPDSLAMQDDLAYAAQALQGDPNPEMRRYLASFLGGLAGHAADPDLAQAAAGLVAGGSVEALRRLIATRLNPGDAFSKPGLCRADTSSAQPRIVRDAHQTGQV